MGATLISSPDPSWPLSALDTRIDRRAVLRLGAAAAATVALGLTGCGASRHGASPPSPGSRATSPAQTGTSAPPTTGTPDSATPADWADLRASLTGTLVLPTDPNYLTDLQLYDSRFDTVRPAAVAYCAAESDVQRCIDFVRRHELALAPRSGGHSYGGYSTTTGLVIDITRIAAVNPPSPGPGPATVGAGARLIDVYTALNNEGVSIPAGSCPTVGIAGLTLGGGVGVVDRAYGLTCDALTAVRVVTADAQVVTASPELNPDLYWACRGGGGGNFGIATSLTFRTFPTVPLTLCFLHWPWSAAAQVLPAWLDWAPHAPDPLWSNCLLSASPGACAPTVQVGVVWLGAPSSATALVNQLETAVGSPPSSQHQGVVPFEHAMYVEGGCANFSQAACHLPAETRGGSLARQPSLAKSTYVGTPISDPGIQAILAGVAGRQSDGLAGAAGFDAYGGAINRVPTDATAFVHRGALASVQYNVPFTPGTPPDQLDASQAWLDNWVASVQPYMNGQAYQNYIDPHLVNWAEAYYGSNLGRLESVKRIWDPDGVFRFAQAIPQG